MRKTKIVATIGPASESYEQLETLAKAGVNVFRLNFSHGTHEWHANVIKRIKRLNKEHPGKYAILLDTKGPEIRSGDLKVPVEVEPGDTVTFSTRAGDYAKTGKIGVSYDAFVNDVEVGEKILVDSGVMSCKVSGKTDTDVVCEVVDGGEITSRRHLNIPGKDVSLEAITEKDWADIAFGVEMGVDFIALSFVRHSTEIYELKKYLKNHHNKAAVIAKIESFEATNNLEEIVQAADGVMVARGDLGAEIEMAEVPGWQLQIVQTAAHYKKPVIIATHMLESMIEHPVPTRAEVTDISAAVWQSADAVMLSGETANGAYPVRAVETMRDIVKVAERANSTEEVRDLPVLHEREAFALMACTMPLDLPEVEAIVVITRSGQTARFVSSFRPGVPVFAFTNETKTRHKLQLVWGVNSFLIDFSSEPEKTIERAEAAFLQCHPDWAGRKYVLVSDCIVEDKFIQAVQVRDL